MSSINTFRDEAWSGEESGELVLADSGTVNASDFRRGPTYCSHVDYNEE